MSNGLSFRERLERPGRTEGADPGSSDSPSRAYPLAAVLAAAGPIPQPVTLALALKATGLSLRAAHDAVTRVAAGEHVALVLPAVPDPARAAEELAALGLAVEWRRPPDTVDVRAIREKLGLTQSAFAARFGLELDSVRNWEQGRYAPDPLARTLLRIIDQDPAAVDRAVAA